MWQQMTPTRVMINTAAALFVIGMAWLLFQVRAILVLLLFGILFAAAIEPLVYRLRRYGFTRGQAIMSIYFLLAATLGLVVYLIVPSLVRQATTLWNDIPLMLDDLKTQAIASDNAFVDLAGRRTLDRLLIAYYTVQQNPPIEGSTAVNFATSVVGALFTAISVMIVAFYWMTEKAIIKRIGLSFVPLDKRDRAHSLWDQVELRIGGWARGQLILCGTIGTLSAAGYFAIGLDFWLALGLLAGITEIIPFIGPFLAGSVAVTVALTESWEQALLVAIFAIVLQQLEGAFLVPRVMRNAVGMTPLTVILAVLVGGALGGPLGAIMAIPLGAAVQVFLQDILRTRAAEADSTLASETDAQPTAEDASVSRGAPQHAGREATKVAPGRS
ncbi:MAG: AI-2E family transporter [Thermomicrobiales bacterium]